jgi:hypothetical protein
MFSRLREDIRSVFDRDPAARTFVGGADLLSGRACRDHASSCALAMGIARVALAGAPGLASRALPDRYRNSSRRHHRPAFLHRSRDGRGDRRNGGDRRRCDALSRRHPGRHLVEQGQAPSDAGGWCGDRRRGARCSGRLPSARVPRSARMRWSSRMCRRARRRSATRRGSSTPSRRRSARDGRADGLFGVRAGGQSGRSAGQGDSRPARSCGRNRSALRLLLKKLEDAGVHVEDDLATADKFDPQYLSKIVD